MTFKPDSFVAVVDAVVDGRRGCGGILAFPFVSDEKGQIEIKYESL